MKTETASLPFPLHALLVVQPKCELDCDGADCKAAALRRANCVLIVYDSISPVRVGMN